MVQVIPSDPFMSNSFSTSARGRNNFLPLVLAAAVLLGLLAPGRAQLPGTVNPAFAPTVRTNGNIAFIATQADGKQLIGGNFSRVGAVLEPSLARLNIDGSLDTSFASPTGLGSVDYIAVGADGKIFVLYEGASNFNANFTLVSLNTDGSQDDAFVPPTFSGAHASKRALPVCGGGPIRRQGARRRRLCLRSGFQRNGPHGHPLQRRRQ